MKIPDPARWARLSPLLDDLLDLPAAERAARLAGLRRELPDLADELAALLADDGQAASQRFLTGAVTPAIGLGPAPGPGASLAGQRLGAYVLESALGQGGGGSVWRARREDGRFDGVVAIKLLHLSLLGRAGAERFRREGQILARLTHPHIAHLLDAGVTPGGQPYLVLELVQGERIDRHCDAHHLGVAARLALFDDVMSAVAHAHTHGVIHRDLKPGNILVSADGCVKLLDFGIAKLLADETDGPAGAEATALTREGGRALTPEYAAPEQLRGEGVTTATDVYALGVLLYQLLAGRHPTATALSSAVEVMRGTLETEPLRLSRSVTRQAVQASGAADAPASMAALRGTSPQRLQRSLTGDLDTIVAHALRKLPSERYATVAALADDLRRHRLHQPVLARPDTLAYRARKFVRRNRSAVGAAALLVLAIGVGLAGTLSQARRAEHERAEALHQLALSEATADLLKFLVGSATGKSVTAADLLTRAEALADKQFVDTPAALGQVLLQLADLWQNLGNTQRTADLAGRARQAATLGADAPSQLRADCVLAGVAVDRGDFETAQRRLQASFQQGLAMPAGDPQALLGCLLQRATIAREQARPAAVLADVDEALRLLPQPRLGQWQTVVALRSLRAGAYAEQGRLGAAVREYLAMLADVDRTGRAGMVTNITALNDAGAELLRAGQTQMAVAVLGRGFAISLAAGARDDVDLPTESNYARALFEAGRLDEALPLFDHALAVSAALKDARTLGNVALIAAAAHGQAGHPARALALLQTSREQLASFLPAGHPLFAQVLIVRARLALAAGAALAARGHLQGAFEQLARAEGNQPRRITPLILQARIALQLGELDAGLRHATEAVQVAQSQLGDLPASIHLGHAALVLGQVQGARGDMAAARASLGQALGQYAAAVGPASPPAADARRLLAGL